MSLMTYGTNDFVWSKQKTPEFLCVCVCVCIKWLQKLQKKHGENVVLKELKSIMAKKQKTSQKKKMENIKHFLQAKQVFLLLKNVQCCKLPEAIELRKKLRYNHKDIIF